MTSIRLTTSHRSVPSAQRSAWSSRIEHCSILQYIYKNGFGKALGMHLPTPEYSPYSMQILLLVPRHQWFCSSVLWAVVAGSPRKSSMAVTCRLITLCRSKQSARLAPCCAFGGGSPKAPRCKWMCWSTLPQKHKTVVEVCCGMMHGRHEVSGD